MKITTFLLFLVFMQASATVFSQSITFKQNDATLKDIFSEINKQTGYNVFWSYANIKNIGRQDVDFRNTSLEEVLKATLKNTQLTFTIEGKTVIIEKAAPEKVSLFKKANPPVIDIADITITGTVKDSKGVTLPGVSVFVADDPKRGTMTDNNGKFVLDVKNGAVIKVSFIGFVTQTFTITPDNKTLNIVLAEDVKQADEVIVTAYGKKQTREAIVGSVTTVKPGNLKVPASNLTNALAGQVAGIIAYQPSGQPGVDNSNFFIRGVTTFGYRQSPLILIDNVELTASDLARLNVDDIESFSILKDASATALYGARGGNGVILVKTKEGKAGKAQINARMEASSSQSVKNIQLADPITYMKLFNEATQTRYPLNPLPYTPNQILNTQATIDHAPGSNPYVYPAVNWLDLLFKKRTATQRGDISVQGGGGVARYYVAGSFSNDAGILRTDIRNNNNNNVNFKNYQLRSNVNINVTSKTELIVRLSGTFNEYNGPRTNDASLSTDLYNLVMHTSPVDFPAYYPADSANLDTKHILFGNVRAAGGGPGSTQYINPYASLLSGHQNFSESRMLAQLELNQSLDFLTQGLNFHSIFSTNRYARFQSQMYYNPFYYTYSNYNRQSNQYTLQWINNQPGQAQEYLTYAPGASTLNTFFYLQGVLDYSRTFGKNHNVSASLIGTEQQTTNANAGSLFDSLPFRNQTVAGRATYSYKSRYYLEFNFGYNGSERFSVNHRYGFFPTIGASWIISDEKFWGDLYHVFDRFKLRASYGSVGNDQIGSQRFFYLSDVNLNGGNPASFGTNGTYTRNGVNVNNYENDDVTWETSKQTNLGIEFTLFKKFNVIAEVYNNDKSNILQNRASIPSSLGLESGISANIGKVNSRGIDISVDGQQSIGKDLYIGLRGNFTYSANKYTQYEEPHWNESYRYNVGQPLNRQYGYVAERLFVDDNDARNSPPQIFSTNGTPPMGGDIKYRDLNGDGKIDGADQTFLGNPSVPQIVYGFGVSATYKNFDLSGFFQGQAKVSFLIDAARTAPFIKSPDSYFTGNTQLLQAYADNHWSEDHQDIYALYPRLGPDGAVIENNRQSSTWWLRDGSFLRLKSMEIGYSLPASVTKTLNVKKARIYFNGLNLLTWSPFKLWDPEQGGNAFAYPVQKVFNVGLNVNL
ncbi:TonB-dependent receptor [Mucilaginibacter angelicae]|uniref:TonB-dependent receptor n=1 Tax=Mucilaginibacter angelicae TaxID=869718 RepID=A0ABV6L5M1_9SPHI